MRLTVTGHATILSDALKSYIERRLGFCLDRFGPRIKSVRVKVTDQNGPRGGVDKACQVSVSLVRGGTVVVSSVAADLYHAVDHASDRAKFALTRSAKKISRTRVAVESATP